MRAKLFGGAVIFIFIAAFQVVLGVPYRDVDTALMFPDECANWTKESEEVFEKKELGFTVAYGNAQRKTLNVYVYDAGVPEIPSGADSDLLLNLTRQTSADVTQVWTDRGGTVEEIHPPATIRDASAAKGLATLVAHRILMKDQVLISISGLTGYRGKIVKVRYTYSRSPLDEGIADLKEFVLGLVAANRTTLDEYFVAWADKQLPGEGAPSREAVLAAADELEKGLLRPGAADAVGVVMRFAQRSEDVTLVIAQEALPWVLEVEKDAGEARTFSGLLLGVYIAANVKAQLIDGNREQDVLAGWVSVLRAYRELREKRSLKIDSLDALAQAQDSGELADRAKAVQAVLRSAAAP